MLNCAVNIVEGRRPELYLKQNPHMFFTGNFPKFFLTAVF